PYVQVGDFKLNNTGGHVQSYTPEAGIGSSYLPGVVRLVTSLKAGVPASSNWDLATYGHKDNDPAKGPVIYLAGHNYAGSIAGERMVLNTLLVLSLDAKVK